VPKKLTDLGHYSGAGIQMALTMIVCWWIGMKLGLKFNFEPWGSIGGLFFGMFAGMYNLIKSVK
jgi:ATP synthase protein I